VIAIKKIILSLTIALVVLALMTLSIDLALQSGRVHEQFHRQAEKIVGVPLKMGRLSFYPLAQLHLSDLTMTDASHGSLQAFSVDLMPEWSSLFSRCWGNTEELGCVLRIRQLTWNQKFSLQNIKACISKRATGFSIDPFLSRVANGEVAGSFVLQEEQRLSPYQLNISFSGVSLKELMKGVPSLEGKVKGTFSMRGSLNDLEKKEGEGFLKVDGMKFKPGGPLSQIGQLLGIQELQLLKFYEAVAAYSVTPHQLLLKSLRLRSDNLMIRAHGTISYEGILHLNALLLLNQKLQSRLQGLLPATLLVPSDELGFVALPFEISGSLDHPYSNLLEHVPLPALNSNVQGLLQQIFKF
jgi:hypothetical protein